MAAPTSGPTQYTHWLSQAPAISAGPKLRTLTGAANGLGMQENDGFSPAARSGADADRRWALCDIGAGY